jgi:hypothetical protein
MLYLYATPSFEDLFLLVIHIFRPQLDQLLHNRGGRVEIILEYHKEVVEHVLSTRF